MLSSPRFFYYGPFVSGEAEKQLLDLSHVIARRGLREVSIFFLEMFKPLAGCAHELLIFGEPMAVMLFGREMCEQLKALLSSSERVEALIRLLEDPASHKSASISV
jgi:hypothetical protein